MMSSVLGYVKSLVERSTRDSKGIVLILRRNEYFWDFGYVLTKRCTGPV